MSKKNQTPENASTSPQGMGEECSEEAVNAISLALSKSARFYVTKGSKIIITLDLSTKAHEECDKKLCEHRGILLDYQAKSYTFKFHP
jgi:hypothetical protein